MDAVAPSIPHLHHIHVVLGQRASLVGADDMS